MKQIELEHPALIETIRRILTQENAVPTASVRDFDGNEYHVKVDLKTQMENETTKLMLSTDDNGKLYKGGSVTVEIAHSLSAAFLEKCGAKPFLVKVLQRHFAHDTGCFLVGSSGDKATVTVRLDTSDLTVDAVITHPTIRKAAQLRLLVVLGPYLMQFDKFLISKNAGQDLPFLELPFSRNAGGGANEARMFLYSANANFISLLYLRVPHVDERIFVRTFLHEMQGLSGDAKKGLAGSVGMSYVAGALAPSLPANAPGAPAATDDCFYVTFVVSKRHMDPIDVAERVVRQIIDFRAFLSYHVGCCKSNLHAAMRKRAEASLLVIARAKTKTTGRPRIAIDG